MASLNKVILAGNLTRDPEVRYTSSGTAVADLGIAVNERFKDATTGEWKEKPVYVDIVVWGRQAETSGEYLTKGSPVLIDGRLQLDQWETKEGDKRSKLRVVANNIQFLSSRRDTGSGSGTAPSVKQEVKQPAEVVQTSTNPSPKSAPASDTTDTDNLPF